VTRAAGGRNIEVMTPAKSPTPVEDSTDAAFTADSAHAADSAVRGERIVSTPGTCGGKPRISGHRIKVADIAIWYERTGLSPDEIVSEWPTLTLSDVHAALAYYYDHRDQIDTDIRAGEEFVDKYRAGQPSIFEKVRQRRLDASNDPIPS
jgi:uncharacterized protein (DUF433 family)